MRAIEEMADGNIAPPVAPIHWIDGLLCFALGREADGLSALERELQLASIGHLYATEVGAQVWYTKASARYLDGAYSAAQAALEEVFRRMPYHPQAIASLFLIERRLGRVKPGSTLDDMEIWRQSDVPVGAPLWFERQVGIAIVLVDDERHEEASALLGQALDLAPPGNSGWLIPLDLLLKVQSNKPVWRRTLARLSTRARRWLPAANA
jgi:tetratricopeptide (TPR) repeat protein